MLGLHYYVISPTLSIVHFSFLVYTALLNFRTVNLTTLTCTDDQGSEEVSTDAVCATNGVTYPSVCRLLQDTGNEAVAYAGECEREECQGGSVSTIIKRMCTIE